MSSKVRNLMALGVVGLLVSLGLGFAAALAADRPGIAIVDFDNKAQYGGWAVGQGASDMLTTALVKNKEFKGKFKIIEREQIKALLNEQGFQHSGAVDSATAVKMGKVLGVKYIITGAVTEYGHASKGGGGGGVSVGKNDYAATIDIRAVNVQTAEIEFADTTSGRKSSTSVNIFGVGGGESFDEKKATEALRDAINEMAVKLATDLSI